MKLSERLDLADQGWEYPAWWMYPTLWIRLWRRSR